MPFERTKYRGDRLVRIEMSEKGEIFVINDLSKVKVHAADGDVAKKIQKAMQNYYRT